MAKEKEQNLGLPELKAALKNKNIGRLYFFYGEETFLMNHYLQQVRKQLLDEVTESFNAHRFTAETFDMAEFIDAVENLPMMAEHTMVQVDEIDLFKMNEADRNKMTEVLNDIPDYCTVIFTYVTVAWKPDKRLKKLWEAVDKNGTAVEFARQEQRDLIPWVSRHFAARKKKITNDLCAYLIEITGGTMTALNGEIEKICAYSGADEIRRTDIDAVTEPVLDAVVFQMTDLLTTGNYDKALLKLRQLLQMQEEPLMILGAVGMQFRRLGAARTLLDQGRNVGDMQKLCGLTNYPARKTMDSAQRISAGFCEKSCDLVLETDRKMKSQGAEPEQLLELLILQLAQEAGRG